MAGKSMKMQGASGGKKTCRDSETEFCRQKDGVCKIRASLPRHEVEVETWGSTEKRC